MSSSFSRRTRDVAALLCALSSSVVALGCGGRTDITGAESDDSSGAGEASSSVAPSDASARPEDSGATTDEEDADGRVQVGIEYTPPSFIGVDCEPSAPADPVGVFVNVVFDTPVGETPQDVTFPAARIEFTAGSRSLTWNFQVMTEVIDGPSAAPPETTIEMTWNVTGSGSGVGTGAPCDYCGEMAEFEIEVSSPGQSPYWAGAFSPVTCTK